MKSKRFTKSVLVLAVIVSMLLISMATVFAAYDTKELIVGETATYSTVSDYYGETISADSIYKWQVNSSNSHIVSHNGNGSFTALAPGKAAVFVYYYDGCYYCNKGYDMHHSATFYINVSDAEIYEKFFFIRVGESDMQGILRDGKLVDNSQVKWSIEDESIATIDANGIITGVSYGQTMVHGEYKGQIFSGSVMVLGQDNCKLSSTSKTLTTGVSTTLKLNDAKGNTVSNSNIKWTSSNKSIATVSTTGSVKAVKAGTATITAEFEGNEYSCKVTVKDATISRTSYTLTTGGTLNLSMKNAVGTTISKKNITWKSSNTKVATVTTGGAVKGIKAGTATITGTYQGKAYTCKITVKNATLSKTSFSIVKGKTYTLSMKNAAGTTISKKNITWKSSNTKVATVNSSGTVKAVKAGTATITGTYQGKAYTCKVTVKNMSISKTSATLYMGDTLTLSVNGNDDKTTWSTSSSKIAKVSSKGVVTPVKPGTVTITAKKGGDTFKCKVTVAWPPETGTTKTKSYTYTNNGEYFTYELKGKGTIKVTGQITALGSNSWLSDRIYMAIEDKNYSSIVYKEFTYADGKQSISATVPAGTYKVYVTTYDKAKFSISVTTKPTILAPAKNLGRGYTHQFKVTGVKNKGTWSTSDKKIATITSDGVLKGVKNGSCTVYYTMKDGKKISYKVNIVDPVTIKLDYISDTTIFNECGVEFCNNTGKKIEYIDFNITQYNYRGSKLRSPYDYYYCAVSVDPYSTREREYWVHDNTGKVKLKLNYARFTDGKKYKP